MAMERLSAIRSDASSSFCCQRSGGASALRRSDELTLDHALKPRAALGRSAGASARPTEAAGFAEALRTIESIRDLNRKTYDDLG